MIRPTSLLATSFLATLLAAAVPGPAAGQSTFDDLWSLADWYVDERNAVVQSLVFTGRFQYEYASVHDDPSSHDEWNVRRMRMGIRSLVFRRLTVHVEAELNPQERDPFYTRLTDAYLEWSRTPTLVVTLGKQGVAFTM
ncbi:MAG TPA: hypothetical protein VM198_11015, partial [Longimicrobiales bacterium]|nr:hypothetical protein [Longimicrobiales bacterium]